MKFVNRDISACLIVMVVLSARTIAMEPAYNALELPYNAADRSQLFVDQLLVRQADGVWFTQHQGKKHPQNPLLVADKPWEGWRLELFGSVIYDEQDKIFKMWYLPQPGGGIGNGNEYFDVQCVTCYATSKDGIHWEKPLVGTYPSKNGKPHNAVGDFHHLHVIKEMNDPDPARRYKASAWDSHKPHGGIILTSPDGLNWKKLKTSTPIAPDCKDVLTVFWDYRRGLYVAFTKTGRTPNRGLWRRVFNTVTSKDLDHWSEPVWSWKPDWRDDVGALARIEQVRPLLYSKDDIKRLRSEYYGVGAYLAESCTLGFPWVITINNNKASKANGGGGWHDGPQEIQLAVSRDLYNWQRPFRTPVIEIGQLDQWDAAYQSTAGQAIRVGDEIRLYYSGGNYTHGTPLKYVYTEDGKFIGRDKKCTGSIGLVTWKLDRFVSVDGPAEGGTLTTVPMVFSGNRLVINAATKPGGKIVVELLDAGDRSLKDFPSSEPFSGDDLRHEVQFKGKGNLTELQGRPVTLKFHIVGASLYSFAFRK